MERAQASSIGTRRSGKNNAASCHQKMLGYAAYESMYPVIIQHTKYNVQNQERKGFCVLASNFFHLLTDGQAVDEFKVPIQVVGRDRTVGVDLSTMKLAHGEVSVWDFGGQLEYAVTHQLLLSVEVFSYRHHPHY